jgi:hypothetical protein
MLEANEANDADSENKRELEDWLREYDTWIDVTCACGFGYYTIQGEWVPGVDVRAGRAPPKLETPLRSIHVRGIYYSQPNALSRHRLLTLANQG